MKAYTALLALAFAAIGSSRFVPTDSQTTVEEPKYKVPGDNPLYFCADPSEYIGQIDYVNLSPNPPVPGQTLSIRANGTFTEDIDEGAKVQLRVKYNTYITLINTVQDLCENLPRVDLECPLKKGSMPVSKDADIPRQVPPGLYQVFANVVTADGKEIVCMEAAVRFNRGG